jgi:hypothetical protein
VIPLDIRTGYGALAIASVRNAPPPSPLELRKRALQRAKATVNEATFGILLGRLRIPISRAITGSA